MLDAARRRTLGDAPLVFAGASQAELLARAAREGHVRRERLDRFGAGGAQCRRSRAIVAMEAGCSPARGRC